MADDNPQTITNLSQLLAVRSQRIQELQAENDALRRALAASEIRQHSQPGITVESLKQMLDPTKLSGHLPGPFPPACARCAQPSNPSLCSSGYEDPPF